MNRTKGIRLNKVKGVVAGVLLSILAGQAEAVPKDSNLRKVLVVNGISLGWVHSDAFTAGEKLFKDLAAENGFTVTFTKELSIHANLNALKAYDVLVWNNLDEPEKMSDAEKKGFENYMMSGGNFVGIHGAGDLLAPQNWTWMVDMYAYGRFREHTSGQNNPMMHVDTEAAGNEAVEGLAKEFRFVDEYYGYQKSSRGAPGVKILLTVDEATYNTGDKGKGAMGADHPMSWVRKLPGTPETGGRYFYTALGHHEQAISNPIFRKHIYGALLYAAGYTVPSVTIEAGRPGGASRQEDGSLLISLKKDIVHTVEVFDLEGRRIRRIQGTRKSDYRIDGLTRAGVYFVRVTTPRKVVSERMVLKSGW